MEAAEILVIILSIAFALFLILAIVLVVLFIKIASQLRRITSSAERTINNFENVAGIIQKAMAPALITKLVGELVQKITHAKKKKEDEED